MIIYSREDSGRAVFEISETSRLVEVTDESWRTEQQRARSYRAHFRVSVARLVHTEETPPAHPPAKKPGIVHRALGGGR